VLADPLAGLLANVLRTWLPDIWANAVLTNIKPFLQAGTVIVLFGSGFLVAYNVSALINWVFVVTRSKPRHKIDGPPQRPAPAQGALGPFQQVQRIGIVLAGGGAKGAYQAGAMKAIYRFLEQHDALRKVHVIAGTSIGSWNALFWLAELIKPAQGWAGQSVHEAWWRNISAKGLTAPSWYMPLWRNAFLSSRPWQQSYDQIFGRLDVAQTLLHTPIRYYLTRSDVYTGRIECATNNPRPPLIPSATFDVLDRKDSQGYARDLKSAVFASMDLPPLFPFSRRGFRSFEDGGVIDNLPITFAAAEGCDLLFILPLNADFEQTPNTHSVLARLLRVMDVRQGALERGGFKMLYLYNELAALRSEVQAQAAAGAVSGPVPPDSRLAYSLQRQNNLINVFAVCPAKAFVEQVLNTTDLWKKRGAAQAFETMHNATASLLPDFPFQGQQKVRVAIVNQGGSMKWDEQF
jgi:NTE family protein